MLLFHIRVVCNQIKFVREGVDGTVGYKGSVPTGVQPFYYYPAQFSYLIPQFLIFSGYGFYYVILLSIIGITVTSLFLYN